VMTDVVMTDVVMTDVVMTDVVMTVGTANGGATIAPGPAPSLGATARASDAGRVPPNASPRPRVQPARPSGLPRRWCRRLCPSRRVRSCLRRNPAWCSRRPSVNRPRAPSGRSAWNGPSARNARSDPTTMGAAAGRAGSTTAT